MIKDLQARAAEVFENRANYPEAVRDVYRGPGVEEGDLSKILWTLRGGIDYVDRRFSSVGKLTPAATSMLAEISLALALLVKEDGNA